jgi:hydroxyacylglutathione hydrolase
MQIVPLSLGFVQAYLIKEGDSLILVDAGMPRREKTILQSIRQIGGELRLIFITHAHLDHYGSAAALQRLSRAPVAIHRADAEDMTLGKSSVANTRRRGNLMRLMLPIFQRMMKPQPCRADILLNGNEDLAEFGFHAHVISTPGHSPGSCSLVTADGTAFVGDLLTVAGGKASIQRFNAQDWAQVCQSTRKLADMGIEQCYTGHGNRPITRGELAKLAQED